MGEATRSNRAVDSETDMAGVERDAREYHVRRSRLIKMINWWHVGTTFYPHVFVALLCYLASQVTFDLVRTFILVLRDAFFMLSVS
mmetsp:Transcript_8683/g.35769  ORF Transcript_8683/g.35769 Transcript_8683/m.35769 type:complete len:86 (+) Transcript_8683:159-416(+)